MTKGLSTVIGMNKDSSGNHYQVKQNLSLTDCEPGIKEANQEKHQH